VRPPVSQDRQNIEKPAPVNPLREVWKGGRVCLSPPVSGDWSTRTKRLSTGFNSRTPGELMKVYQKPTIRQIIDSGSGGESGNLLSTLPQKTGSLSNSKCFQKGCAARARYCHSVTPAGCWQLKAGASEKTAEKRPFCSTESGKTNILGYIQANPKSTNRPPLSEGGGTSLEGVIDPIRYAPRNPPISDKKSPRKRAGTSSRGLFERPKTEIFPGGNPRAEESPPYPPYRK